MRTVCLLLMDGGMLTFRGVLVLEVDRFVYLRGEGFEAITFPRRTVAAITAQ